jgi:transposase
LRYLLCLELTDPGFHYSVLSEFRARLLEGEMEQVLFERLLTQLRERKLLKGRGQQRTDSTQVLGAVRTLNRLELVVETMRYALNTLAVTAPDGLLAQSESEWVDRYRECASDYRLPKNETGRLPYAELIGTDGLALLTARWDEQTPDELRQLDAVQTLCLVWFQNYTWNNAGGLR